MPLMRTGGWRRKERCACREHACRVPAASAFPARFAGAMREARRTPGAKRAQRACRSPRRATPCRPSTRLVALPDCSGLRPLPATIITFAASVANMKAMPRAAKILFSTPFKDYFAANIFVRGAGFSSRRHAARSGHTEAASRRCATLK